MFYDPGECSVLPCCDGNFFKALDLIKVLALREQITFWPNLP